MEDEIPKHRKRGKKKKYKIVYETMNGKPLYFKQKYTTLKAAEQALENFNNGGGGWPNNKDYKAKIEEI